MDDDRADAQDGRSGARSELIYCGLCGALNPSTNFYCAACGTTLVDAFHATEGMRVFERPDPAARVIEIVPSGSALELVDDANAPADWLRVRLPYGRLGYLRAADVGRAPDDAAAVPFGQAPDVNTRALGCVSTTGALAALALLVLVAIFGVVIVARAPATDAGVLALVYCVAVVPLLLLTIGLYVGARAREDRMADEADESRQSPVASRQNK